MAKNKNIQKAERESLNIKDKLLETLKASTPEVFAEGKVNWDKVRLALGEHLDTSSEKFNFTWAGKSGAIQNVLISSKATLKPAKKESVKFDESENIFIEGDNLEVLKLLQKSYFESIKMIYIDPPYNTGNDFVYRDDFRNSIKNYLEQSGQVDSEGNRLQTNTQTSGRFHSDWLNMMYPRLKIAWNLLRHDGAIFVSIDDNEISHLRMMMDEIFGEENFIGQITWHRKRGKDNSAKYLSRVHEFVLIYCKTIQNLSFDRIALSEETLKQYSNPENDPRGKYRKLALWRRGGQGGSKKFSFTTKEGAKVAARSWLVNEETMKKLDSENKLVVIGNGLYRKLFLSEHNGSIPETIWLDTSNTANATDMIKEIFGVSVFDTPKPIELVQRMLKLSTLNNAGEIILDFFAGSGTTAHAVLVQNQEDKGNRKFIMVQMPEPTDPKSEAYKAGYKTIADICKERIRRVIKGYGKNKPINDGFKVFKLDKSNYVENLFEYDPVKSADENNRAFKEYLDKSKNLFSHTDLNEINVVYENVIKEGLNLNAKITELNIGKNKVYQVNDGEREILVCVDKTVAKNAIEALSGREYHEKIFICLDGALDDSDKANLALNLSLKTI